jgi:hypothetical protein
MMMRELTRIVDAVVVVLAILTPMCVRADPSDYSYSVTDGEATITGYTGAGGDISIPSSLDGYPVINLRGTFCWNRSLTSVIVPDSVVRLLSELTHGYNAGTFRGCNNLKAVTLPRSVTDIGASTFDGCSGLTNLTIPDSVTSIGSAAFYGCSGLTNLTIPDSVTSIGSAAFSGCTGLTALTIPDSVTSIGDDAFQGCASLASVIIPTRFLSTLGVLFDPPVASLVLLQGVAGNFRDQPEEYGIATETYVSTEKLYQPIGSAISTGAAMVVAPTSSVQHLTIAGSSPVDVAWDLSGLNLTGQAATWEAWITVENAGTQVSFPAPLNATGLRVHYLSGTNQPTTSANGETIYSVWRAFKLGSQTNLICNQWLHLDPAP